MERWYRRDMGNLICCLWGALHRSHHGHTIQQSLCFLAEPTALKPLPLEIKAMHGHSENIISQRVINFVPLPESETKSCQTSP
eukprot:scaffold87550_cov14-Tisochrysis_lutea.AAC.1